MMEVIELDGFAVSMFGDCFETLLWVEQGGETPWFRLCWSRFGADAILLHEADGRQLVEVKAPAFVE